MRAFPCPNCGALYDPVGCHWRCPECGFKESCCEGEPQLASSVATTPQSAGNYPPCPICDGTDHSVMAHKRPATRDPDVVSVESGGS